MIRVLHLVGSSTDEFHADLSRLYARDCWANTADPARYDFRLAHVAPGNGAAPGGRWSFPDDPSDAAIAAAPTMPAAEAIGRLGALGVDVAVPQMFDRVGMTSYRALFDVLGVPFVGNTATTMALAADKAAARAVVATAGVDVPDGEVLRAGERPTLGPPVVVKPADADNSVGVTLVRDASGYDAAVAAAAEHSDRVLVERYVALGREVRCGLLETADGLVGLPLEEYRMDTERLPVRDLDDKIGRDDGGGMRLMAKDERSWIVDPADPLTDRVHAAARACHVALGGRHHGLFDFRIDPDGRPWFLEASPYCSFARQSVVATMAAAAGIDLPDLFARSLARALACGHSR